MSLISGKYWTGDPKIKPDAWGPVEYVQAAIRENIANIYGINPESMSLCLPMWGPGDQLDYASLVNYQSDAQFNKQSIEFSGSDKISLNSTKLGNAEFTIIAGFKTNLKAAQILYGEGVSSSNYPVRYISIFSDGTIQFLLRRITGTPEVNIYSSGPYITDNKNHSVAAIYDSTYDGHLFVDGSYVATNYGGYFNESWDRFTIGALVRTNTTYYFTGQYNYLYIFHTDIDSTKISKLSDHPYGLLQPITRRSYFIPSGDITIKTISDSGFCSDNISGITNQLSVIDIGSGIDGFYGMSADLYVSDTGSGVESITPAVSVSVNDTASAIDAISQILSYCSVVDSGSGADSIANILASVAVADAGSGFDIINVLKELLKTVTDSCLGVDNVSQITVSSSVSDSASGVDIISQILADISVSDTGSGADFLSLIKDILKTISDGGTGVDSVSIQPVSVSVQDVGLALDIIGHIAAYLSLTDAAIASEIISTIKTKLVAVSDSGIGSDNQSISVSLTVADTITAIDTIKQIINALSISDAGFAIESIAKIDLDNTPTGHVRITITLKAPGINITSRAPGINISTQ